MPVIYDKHILGSVAEAGVFRGEFAVQINSNFPDRKLYLFDTFSGFAASDLDQEKETTIGIPGGYADTSSKLVLDKMPHPQHCIIKEGLFPDTTKGIVDTFCFVNLDMDLYKPTLGGLEFFWGKMVEGGVILVHDYYSGAYPNVKHAVSKFEQGVGHRLRRIPIGDKLSMAIIK